MNKNKIKKVVRESYGEVAKGKSSCCGGYNLAENISKKIGYSKKEMDSVPKDANLGLGCGNPTALASLKKGEVVLDLGSGAGFDCFLAAKQVGEKGRVIGVDMTPEMIKKARKNAKKAGYKNVEFRFGEIEKLPVENSSVNIVISNCVINLSPDKKKVFKESFRVLKSGGRLMVSDIVLLKDLPSFMKKTAEAYVGCLSGAIKKDKYLKAIKDAGFKKVKIIDEFNPSEFMVDKAMVNEIIKKYKVSERKLKNVMSSILSIKVYAIKPYINLKTVKNSYFL